MQECFEDYRLRQLLLALVGKQASHAPELVRSPVLYLPATAIGNLANTSSCFKDAAVDWLQGVVGEEIDESVLRTSITEWCALAKDACTYDVLLSKAREACSDSLEGREACIYGVLLGTACAGKVRALCLLLDSYICQWVANEDPWNGKPVAGLCDVVDALLSYFIEHPSCGEVVNLFYRLCSLLWQAFCKIGSILPFAQSDKLTVLFQTEQHVQSWTQMSGWDFLLGLLLNPATTVCGLELGSYIYLCVAANNTAGVVIGSDSDYRRVLRHLVARISADQHCFGADYNKELVFVLARMMCAFALQRSSEHPYVPSSNYWHDTVAELVVLLKGCLVVSTELLPLDADLLKYLQQRPYYNGFSPAPGYFLQLLLSLGCELISHVPDKESLEAIDVDDQFVNFFTTTPDYMQRIRSKLSAKRQRIDP